MKTCICATNLR